MRSRSQQQSTEGCIQIDPIQFREDIRLTHTSTDTRTVSATTVRQPTTSTGAQIRTAQHANPATTPRAPRRATSCTLRARSRDVRCFPREPERRLGFAGFAATHSPDVTRARPDSVCRARVLPPLPSSFLVRPARCSGGGGGATNSPLLRLHPRPRRHPPPPAERAERAPEQTTETDEVIDPRAPRPSPSPFP